MPQVLSELSQCAEIRNALSRDGGPFDRVYGTLLAYEEGDWAQLSKIAKRPGIQKTKLRIALLRPKRAGRSGHRSQSQWWQRSWQWP
jgi:c-di-GMP-related signal transduction protein